MEETAIAPVTSSSDPLSGTGPNTQNFIDLAMFFQANLEENKSYNSNSIFTCWAYLFEINYRVNVAATRVYPGNTCLFE